MKVTDGVVAAALQVMRTIAPTEHSEEEMVRAMLIAADAAWWQEVTEEARRTMEPRVEGKILFASAKRQTTAEPEPG